MLKDNPKNTRETSLDKIQEKLGRKLRAAIYVRVSTEKQKEKEASLKTQKEACIALCEEQGYEIVYIFEEAWTGTEYRSRPELTKLRDLARQRLIDVVIIYAFDRLARKQEHQAVIIDDLEYNKVKLECVTENFDDSATGQFMRSARAFVAEVENEKRRDRTQRGKLNRLKEGKLLGGNPPLYGYMWNEKRTVYLHNTIVIKVDEEGFEWSEYEVVKCCNRLCLQGYTIRGITKYLMAKGILTRGGKEVWYVSVIGNILTNPAYAGKAVTLQYKSSLVDGVRKTVRRSPEESFPLPEGVIPAIIDMATFEEVQRVLKSNKDGADRNNHIPQNSLLRGGYIKCGHCNGNMNVKNSSSRKLYGTDLTCYICSKKNRAFGECEGSTISTPKIDRIVWEKVTERVKQLSRTIKWVDEQMKKLQGTSPVKVDLPSIQIRLQKINKKISNLIAMSEKDLDEETLGEVNGQLVEASKQKKTLLEMQKGVKEKQVQWDDILKVLSEFRQWCIDTAGNVENASYDEKRRAIRALGVKVTIWRTDHNPRYEIEMTPPTIVSTMI